MIGNRVQSILYFISSNLEALRIERTITMTI